MIEHKNLVPLYIREDEQFSAVYNYVKDRVTAFEDRGEIVKADVNASFEQQTVSYDFYVRVKKTNIVVKLPTWVVSVGTA